MKKSGRAKVIIVDVTIVLRQKEEALFCCGEWMTFDIPSLFFHGERRAEG